MRTCPLYLAQNQAFNQVLSSNKRETKLFSLKPDLKPDIQLLWRKTWSLTFSTQYVVENYF